MSKLQKLLYKNQDDLINYANKVCATLYNKTWHHPETGELYNGGFRSVSSLIARIVNNIKNIQQYHLIGDSGLPVCRICYQSSYLHENDEESIRPTVTCDNYKPMTLADGRSYMYMDFYCNTTETVEQDLLSDGFKCINN